nr:hypothetical protein [Sulfurimonas sp. SAG-AH-194-I05]
MLQAQEIVSSGKVLINGIALEKIDTIKQGDTIETYKKTTLRFNVGKDAFLVRPNTKFTLDTLGKKRVLNVINGGVMAVFGGGNHGVSTANMTAGIRGTGTYTAVKDGKTYFCTCYGETDVSAHGTSRIMKATHHNMVWITPKMLKITQDMEGHKDEELRILEAMVGRKVPFK